MNHSRVPPHSVETERALLGSVLLDHRVLGIVRGTVAAEDFYAQANATIWETFTALAARGEPIDQITVRAELARTDKLELVGGDEYLLALTDVLPTTAHAETHARLVRDDALSRRLITACHELAARGYEGVPWAEFRAEAERAIRGVTAAEADGEPKHVSDALGRVIREIEARKKSGSAIVGLRTGIKALDRQLSGYQRGRLTVIAGRPGMGKSALYNSTLRVCADPSLVFSIEMPDTEEALRLLVSDAGLDSKDVAEAKMGRDAWIDIARAAERIANLPIYVDSDTRKLDQILAKSRQFAAKHGRIGVIVVDYLQLVVADKRQPREQQVSEISRELKALSKELDCSVVALSQLNRACEDRPDKRPQLSDLRESGAIEQDADSVVFVYRQGYYAALAAKTKTTKRGRYDAPSEIEPGTDDGIAELIVAKNRGGSTGIVRCRFLAQSVTFADLEDSLPPPDDAYHHHPYGGHDE